MNDATVKYVLAEYESRARQNRPDWDCFIDEAQDDPLGIVHEVLDTAEDMNIMAEWDDLDEAVVTWVNSLYTDE
jgi:hypothetical protein